MEFLINNLVIERWGTERGRREKGKGEERLLSEKPKANPSSSHLWLAHGWALAF